jgi:predicted dehydrogenase
MNTRSWFAKQYSIDPTLVFGDWKDLLKASKETIATIGSRLADAVIVAVQDALHREVVVAFAEQGYHILGEKPMATTIEDCIRMEQAIIRSGVIFGVGHGLYTLSCHSCSRLTRYFLLVLRYSPYTKAITEIIRSNSLGKLVNIQHIEPVGYYHFAHSYVRGNWASEAKSSFVLMTKCCQYEYLLF